MAQIVNCRECGRIFQKTVKDICPECVKEQKAIVDLVLGYVRSHPNATTVDVVRDTEVPLEVIVSLIEEGLLLVKDFPNISFECERCGVPTHEGRFCTKCKNELTMELASATDTMKRLAHEKSMKPPTGGYFLKRN